MFKPVVAVPPSELKRRHQACLTHLAQTAPKAGGMLVFSRLHIYYLCGHLGMGCLWLPCEGEPVLMLRKGINRARLESGVERIMDFKSYGEISAVAAEAGSPLTKTIAAEAAGLSWQLGGLLQAKLKEHEFVACDTALALARSKKSEWELEIMRRCGALHHKGLHELLPEVIHPGMSERDAAHKAWEVFYSLGHMGLMRMQAFGEEIFLGHVSAGNSGNYPAAFNGPLGVMGEHPAIPYMGNAGVTWELGMPLSCDIGFSLEGYCTDKTQVYWAGQKSSIDPKIQAAHSFCVDVQAWLRENIKPGVVPSAIYQSCLDMAKSAGMSEGFMGLDENKVVFVGHGIGLSIDGYPALAKGFDHPLVAGNVLALEPKQSVRGKGMVGVENTFEVTADGCVCITGDEYEMICVE